MCATGRITDDLFDGGPWRALCQQPVLDVAGAVLQPSDIGDRVVIEITDAHRRPTERMGADGLASCPVTVIYLPDVSCARCSVEPEQIAGAVVIEVADARDGPALRM